MKTGEIARKNFMSLTCNRARLSEQSTIKN